VLRAANALAHNCAVVATAATVPMVLVDSAAVMVAASVVIAIGDARVYIVAGHRVDHMRATD
jgi:hypothetical protein